jgi:hypothetical protein
MEFLEGTKIAIGGTKRFAARYRYGDQPSRRCGTVEASRAICVRSGKAGM